MAKFENLITKFYNRQLKDSLNGIKEFKNLQDIQENFKNTWFYRDKITKSQYNKIMGGLVDFKTAKNFLIDRIIKYYTDCKIKQLQKLQAIKTVCSGNTQKLWGQCQIEWVKNRTWGYCPHGSYRNGHDYNEYKSVTGCGYDKLSTLTANMFNSDYYLLGHIIKFCERHAINNNNIRERLGYGIRLSTDGMPYFEGGVGIECHVSILKNLGFNVRHFGTKNSDILDYNQK